MSKLYYVSSERLGILNPHERGFKSLERAQGLAAQKAEECSWGCMTPPAPDNEVSRGRGNFRCGAMTAHGIHIRAVEGGIWTDEYDVPTEKFRKARNTAHADWCIQSVIDRGTGYLGDGEGYEFYAGPPCWRGDEVQQWNQALADIAGGDEIVEATVTPLQHGRYWHLMDEAGSDYPLVWKNGGFE